MPKQLLFSQRQHNPLGVPLEFRVPITVDLLDRHSTAFQHPTETALQALLDTGYDGECMTTFHDLKELGYTHHRIWNLVYGVGTKLGLNDPPLSLMPVLNDEGRPRVERISTASGDDQFKPHYGYVHLVCNGAAVQNQLWCLNRSTNQVGVKDRLNVTLLGTRVLTSALLDVRIAVSPE